MSGIALRSGASLECDTIIVATGIQPNIELARAAGLHVGRGIRVDDRMLTSDPHIYAVGECAEHRERVYGIVAPGLEQAAVAAHVHQRRTIRLISGSHRCLATQSRSRCPCSASGR